MYENLWKNLHHMDEAKQNCSCFLFLYFLHACACHSFALARVFVFLGTISLGISDFDCNSFFLSY